MWDAHYYLGLYYKKEGDFKNAEFHLKKALNTKDPDKKLKIKEILKEISGNRLKVEGSFSLSFIFGQNGKTAY